MNNNSNFFPESMAIDYIYSLPVFSGNSLNILCEYCSPDFEIITANDTIFSIELKVRTNYKCTSFDSYLIEKKKVNDLKERHYKGHRTYYANVFYDGILFFNMSERFELDLPSSNFKNPQYHYYQSNNSNGYQKEKAVFYLQYIPHIYNDFKISIDSEKLATQYYTLTKNDFFNPLTYND